MDMTLNKMWIPFCEALAAQFGEDALLDRDQLLHYKITLNIPSIPDEQWFEITNRIFTTPHFWENLEIWEDAARVVSELACRHSVYIVTKPWVHYRNCTVEKINWIEKHLPFFNLENVMFTGDKHLLKGDYLIEDAPQYMDFKDIKVIAIDYPYNRDFKVHLRARDWNDIEEFFGVCV
jgi:5'(3')-deoxyribonucleotidase